MARRNQPNQEFNNPVDFTDGEDDQQIFIANNLPPAAVEYAQAARARAAKKKKAAIPKYTAPAGGAPVAIPNLDSPHQDGLTMEQQAQAVRAAARAAAQHSQSFSAAPSGSIIESQPDFSTHQTTSATARAAELGIMPGDVLPEAATKDPDFSGGMGSMAAASQPRLAMKYGVVRRGQHIPPQKLGKSDRRLRPETMSDLEKIQKLQEEQQAKAVTSLHSSEEEAEESVGNSAAARSATVGDLPASSGIEGMDEFAFDDFRQRMMKDILNNDSQRKVIESRLAPLEIEEMIIHNRVRQTIPVVPNRFYFTLQSMTTEEDMAVKRLIMQESKSVEVSDRYLLDKYALLGMAVALVSVNGKPIGADHFDKDGNFSDEKLIAKFNRLMKLPVHMLASVGVNHFWFEQRVRKLFVAENVGNG